MQRLPLITRLEAIEVEHSPGRIEHRAGREIRRRAVNVGRLRRELDP